MSLCKSECGIVSVIWSSSSSRESEYALSDWVDVTFDAEILSQPQLYSRSETLMNFFLSFILCVNDFLHMSLKQLKQLNPVQLLLAPTPTKLLVQTCLLLSTINRYQFAAHKPLFALTSIYFCSSPQVSLGVAVYRPQKHNEDFIQEFFFQEFLNRLNY